MDIRILIPMFLFGLLAVFSGWLLYETSNRYAASNELRHTPDLYLTQFTLDVMDSSGQPHHRLTGETMRHYPDDESSEIDQPRFSLIEENRVQMTGSAQLGTINSDGSRVVLQQAVDLRRLSPPAKRPLQIESSEMTIWPNHEIATTDSAVTIRDNTTLTTATGLRSNWNSGQHTLLSNVRMIHENN